MNFSFKKKLKTNKMIFQTFFSTHNKGYERNSMSLRFYMRN